MNFLGIERPEPIFVLAGLFGRVKQLPICVQHRSCLYSFHFCWSKASDFRFVWVFWLRWLQFIYFMSWETTIHGLLGKGPMASLSLGIYPISFFNYIVFFPVPGLGLSFRLSEYVQTCTWRTSGRNTTESRDHGGLHIDLIIQTESFPFIIALAVDVYIFTSCFPCPLNLKVDKLLATAKKIIKTLLKCKNKTEKHQKGKN